MKNSKRALLGAISIISLFSGNQSSPMMRRITRTASQGAAAACTARMNVNQWSFPSNSKPINTSNQRSSTELYWAQKQSMHTHTKINYGNVATTSCDGGQYIQELLKDRDVSSSMPAETVEVIKNRLSLSNWIERCKKVTFNQVKSDHENSTAFDSRSRTTTLELRKEFSRTAEKVLTQTLSTHITNEDCWLESNEQKLQPTEDFYNPNSKVVFQPYAQKVEMNAGEQLIVRGDLHGDIHSLVQQLQDMQEQGIIDDQFKLLNPTTKMIFIGDFVNKGWYGCEVLYTVMRLKEINPDQVICLRGNHENIRYNPGVFRKEIAIKFGNHADALVKKIARFYETLPVAVFIGCNNQYVQFSHAGIDYGYNAAKFLNSDKQYQLIGQLERKNFLTRHPELAKAVLDVPGHLRQFFKDYTPNFLFEKIDGKHVNYMWNVATDYIPDDGSKTCDVAYRTIIQFGKPFIDTALAEASDGEVNLHGVIRGHQHVTNAEEPLMKQLSEGKGFSTMWGQKGLHGVCTLNVSPDTRYGKSIGYTEDAYLNITLDNNYDQWQVNIINNKIVKK